MFQMGVENTCGSVPEMDVWGQGPHNMQSRSSLIPNKLSHGAAHLAHFMADGSAGKWMSKLNLLSVLLFCRHTFAAWMGKIYVCLCMFTCSSAHTPVSFLKKMQHDIVLCHRENCPTVSETDILFEMFLLFSKNIVWGCWHGKFPQLLDKSRHLSPQKRRKIPFGFCEVALVKYLTGSEDAGSARKKKTFIQRISKTFFFHLPSEAVYLEISNIHLLKCQVKDRVLD